MDPTGLRARQTRVIDDINGGDPHGLVQCWCVVRDTPSEDLLWWSLEDGTKGIARTPRHWLVGSELCRCGGSGWVCAVCHGKQWVMRPNQSGRMTAQYCLACARLDDCATKPQAWMITLAERFTKVTSVNRERLRTV